MMTIGILTLILVSTSVSVAVEASNKRPDAGCVNSKDSRGLLMADCTSNGHLTAIPGNIISDVQVLDLRHNYIGTLANDSFTPYPNIKKLFLSLNRVHTIEPGSLESLSELETLDLSENAVKEVPAGLPKSLHRLYLSGNPVKKDMRNLASAIGLQVLMLRNCDLEEYPALGVMPNLVELDVSDNERITDLDPVQLAGTCRLVRLNVTATSLFQSGRPGSHCRCRRVLGWAHTYKIRIEGMGPCPPPTDADDDAKSENCTRTPEAAAAEFKACMAEWEHRNTPYWAIFSGLTIVVAVLAALCVCYRRRNRDRRADKVQSVPPTDECGIKENNDTAAAKTDPDALLSSS